MNNYLAQVAMRNVFFHDFITYLVEIKKQPLELTATSNGNIKLKEIKRLEAVFERDIHHHQRDEDGKLRFSVRTETDVPYLGWHKQISRVMYLVYTRNQKIRLSKNGQGFLQNIGPDIQFREMILWYLHRADWRYTHWLNEKLVLELQKKQVQIWQFLLSNAGQWMQVEDFYKSLSEFISELDAEVSDNKQTVAYYDYRSALRSLRWVILEMLHQFDLIDVKEGAADFPNEKKILAFSLNQAGVEILMRALSPV